VPTPDLEHLLSKVGDDFPAGTRAKAVEVIMAAHEAGHEVWFVWGMGGGEHSTGRALDLMVRNPAGGDFVRAYLWQHRARLDVRHIIWQQTITSTTNSPGVVRPMADRGNVTAHHMDHVHVLFLTDTYEAPRAPAPAASRTVTRAPAYPGRQLRRGAKGPAVRAIQERLKDRGWSVKVDGSFGPATERVVRQFQENKRLRVDGIVGRATHAALWLLPVT
jgi:hypothetical protein